MGDSMTLTAMDNYMYLMYSKRRMPRGILAITTDNIQSTASFLKGVEEKMAATTMFQRLVLNRPRVVVVLNGPLPDTMDEMQYAQVREELRQRISAFYGVSNVFMQDSGKGGGLNNEGLQILVTNRAVEYGQKVYTRDLFPRMLKEMGVNDWKLSLYPNEEEDEVTRLRRDEMEVNIAARMAQLGFKPELKEEGDRDIRLCKNLHYRNLQTSCHHHQVVSLAVCLWVAVAVCLCHQWDNGWVATQCNA